ncbi:MAG: NACHT domain-containing protein [Eubacterium sp.]|nr:NACHT domain-containing protein [Eubacterium sp.]
MSPVETQNNLMDTAMESGVKKGAENFANSGLNAIKDFVKKKYGQRQVKLGKVFELYLKNATKRYNQIRTLVTGSDPRRIIGKDNIYVEIGVSHNDERISTTTVDPLLDISNNILIFGTGGIGKSMLMRYLFLKTAQIGEYVPVLIELRRISNQSPSHISILELIYTCMQQFDVELPKEQFEYSLRLGKYLFLFDGFDEVKDSHVAETAEAIQSFCSKYPLNPSIITSRPLNTNPPFETFTSVEAMTLSKEQAINLAYKINTEEEKTKAFCEELDKSLYENHKDFAEIPLLLSMMYLTFMRNNSIPDHLADFYLKAYDALYSAHDNNDKGSYRRDFKCKELDEGNFKLLLSHFCFQTFFNEEYEFTEKEILNYLGKSIEKFGFINTNAKDYLSDLRNIVCIIVKDGNIYRFSHRSFQTYFAATYTSHVLTDVQQKNLFKTLLSRGQTFNYQYYFNLLYQIEPVRFTINAFEKGIRSINREIEAAVNSERQLLDLYADEFVIHFLKGKKKNTFLILAGKFSKSTYFSNLIEIFRQYFNGIGAIYIDDDDKNLDLEIINQYYEKKYGKKINHSDRHLLSGISFRHRFSFNEIDTSVLLTEDERNNLYSAIIKILKLSETSEAICTWIRQLDAKRKSLYKHNFIEDL